MYAALNTYNVCASVCLWTYVRQNEQARKLIAEQFEFIPIYVIVVDVVDVVIIVGGVVIAIVVFVDVDDDFFDCFTPSTIDTRACPAHILIWLLNWNESFPLPHTLSHSHTLTFPFVIPLRSFFFVFSFTLSIHLKLYICIIIIPQYNGYTHKKYFVCFWIGMDQRSISIDVYICNTHACCSCCCCSFVEVRTTKIDWKYSCAFYVSLLCRHRLTRWFLCVAWDVSQIKNV